MLTLIWKEFFFHVLRNILRKEVIHMSRRYFDSSDYAQNRIPAALGYLIFFLPLIVDAKSALNRFCANQGLIGLIAYVVLSIAFAILNFLLGWIPLIGWLVALVGNLAKICLGLLLLYYAWNTFNGKAEELPYIGYIEIIK